MSTEAATLRLAAIPRRSVGSVIGYPLAALTGRLAERRWDRGFSSAVGAMLAGTVLMYLFGLPWLLPAAWRYAGRSNRGRWLGTR